MTKSVRATILLCVATSASLVGCGGEVATEPPPPERSATVQQALLAALDAQETVSAIVNLRDGAPLGSPPGASIHVEGFTVTRTFGHVPALAGRVTRDAVERLRHDPSISYIQLDSPGGGHLKEAVPAIGGDKVKSLYGLTGRGVRVAILDTGVDTTHPDLKDSIVAQHCFTQFDCGFSNEGTSAEDDNGHGSNVAGIITSNGVVSSPGFAPDAEIVAVKVNNANDAGQESDWISGLDWVYENLSTSKVKIVNLSLGTDALYTTAADCDGQEPALAHAVKNLVDAGVTVFVASGNKGSSTQLSAPACNTGAIAVGATYDSNTGYQPSIARTYAARWGTSFADCSDPTTQFDQITCFTNSSARLDLVAPGAPILSDSLSGKTELYWGTSQATPAAAGVAALLLQCKPTLSPAEVKQAMITTGVRRTDPKNGLSFPSIRALDLVRSVCFPTGNDAGVPGSGGANSGGTAGTGATGGAGFGAAGRGNGGVVGGGGTSAAGGPATGGVAGATSSGGASGSGGAGLPTGTGGSVVQDSVHATQRVDAGCACSTLGGPRGPSRSTRFVTPGGVLGFYGVSLVWIFSRVRKRRRDYYAPHRARATSRTRD